MIGRILVIDEDRDVSRFLRLKLDEDLYEVLTAGDPEEGIRMVKKKRPDVVFIDLGMTPRRRLEAVRRIKNVDESIGVVVTTGAGCIDTAKRVMRLGVLDCITKPLDAEILRRLIMTQ